jgi:O-antigen/teichoic acid export membrane protein
MSGRHVKHAEHGAFGLLSSEAVSMGLLVVTLGFSRLLSFLFYLLAARIFATADFGVIRYSISIGTLFFGPTQVLATLAIRHLGAERGNVERIQQLLHKIVTTGFALMAATSLLVVAVAHLGGLEGTEPLGVVAVLVGLTFFELYYAIANGLGIVSRAATVYFSGSLFQLLMLGLLSHVMTLDARGALILFGCGSALPVILAEAVKPLVNWSQFGWHHVRNLLAGTKAARALVVAQAGYLVWSSADQVWVQHFSGSQGMGLYGAAKTLTLVFLILPAGVSGVLMPRLAEMSRAQDLHRARRLFWMGILAVLLPSSLLAALLYVFGAVVLRLLYGSHYTSADGPLGFLAIGMVLYAVFNVVTQGIIGWGNPRVYTVGMTCAAAAECLILLFMPSHTLNGGAISAFASIGLGLVVVMLSRPAHTLLRVRIPGFLGRWRT